MEERREREKLRGKREISCDGRTEKERESRGRERSMQRERERESEGRERESCCKLPRQQKIASKNVFRGRFIWRKKTGLEESKADGAGGL